MASVAGASQGDLDARFGTDGVVVTSLRRSCNGFVLLTGGNILVLSGSEVLRFDARGRLDGTFGIAGRVVVPEERTADLVVASGGRIYLVSRLTQPNPLVKYPEFYVDAYDLTGMP